MTIAIILSTHGSSATQLLLTSEMIAGKQQNIVCVDLFPSENTDNILQKYIKSLSDLKTDLGVLFLVDMWGGTPFNAAQKIILNKENYDIVTGVNIPMIIEVLLARNNICAITELVNIAIKSGSESIKSVNYSISKIVEEKKNVTINNLKNRNYPNILNKTNKQTIKSKNMTISLVRIDDRLIHGQVVVRWAKELNINRIIVINDDIAKDTIRVHLLTQVTPPGITAHIIDVQKAIRVYNNPKYEKDKVIMLLTNPTDVVSLIEGGIPIPSVNIGGMAFHSGKKQIHNAISVNSKDIKSFIKLNQLGTELEIRKVPSDSPIKLMKLIKNMINN